MDIKLEVASGEPLKLERGGHYVIETEQDLSAEQYERIMQGLNQIRKDQCIDFIVLGCGLRIARQSEAEEELARLREMEEVNSNVGAQLIAENSELRGWLGVACDWVEAQIATKHGKFHDQDTIIEDIQALIDEGHMPSFYYDCRKLLERGD